MNQLINSKFFNNDFDLFFIVLYCTQNNHQINSRDDDELEQMNKSTKIQFLIWL